MLPITSEGIAFLSILKAVWLPLISAYNCNDKNLYSAKILTQYKSGILIYSSACKRPNHSKFTL